MWVNIHHTWMVWVVCNLQLLRLASFGFPGSARTRLGCDFVRALFGGLQNVGGSPTKKIMGIFISGFIPEIMPGRPTTFPWNPLMDSKHFKNGNPRDGELMHWNRWTGRSTWGVFGVLEMPEMLNQMYILMGCLAFLGPIYFFWNIIRRISWDLKSLVSWRSQNSD